MFLLQKQSEDLGDHTSSKTQIFCLLFLGHSSWQIKVIQSKHRYQLMLAHSGTSWLAMSLDVQGQTPLDCKGQKCP